MPRIAILLLMLTSLSLFGQKAEPPRFRLGADDLSQDTLMGRTEISSASRSAKYLEDLPVTVYVISRQEILENGYITLVDVLKDVPGIKVSQPGSAVEGETFLQNGLFGNYYCKILVNGIPITPSVVSGTPISGNLPVRQAMRIEIISGPAAALYGSDALSGVINIITMESDRPVWTQADLSVGSQGSYNMNVMIGGKFGKNKNVAEYSLYGNYGEKRDMMVKYDAAGNYNPGLYDTAAASAPYYRGSETEPELGALPMTSSLLGFGLKYRGIKANYDHMSRSSHASVGLNTAQVGYYNPASMYGESIDRISLSYANSWNKFASTTQLSYLYYRLDQNSFFQMIEERGKNGIVYHYSASDDILLEELVTYAVNKNLELSGGASFQISSNLPPTNELATPFDITKYQPFSEEIDASDSLMGAFGYNPVNFNNVAGYVQLFYTFRKMSLLAGGRWDQHSIFGSNLSPKLGLQYKISKSISVRANYGMGFRAPSLYYVYRSLAYPVDSNGTAFIQYVNIPNPDVKPERFSAVEFGIRLNPWRKLEVELIGMYHILKENISYSVIPVDPEKYPKSTLPLAFAAVNDKNSKAELFTGQINFRAKELIPAVGLNSDLYLTFSKGKEILPNELGTLSGYRNMPGWMIQWNFDLKPLKKWRILMHNTFSDKWQKRFFPLSPEVMKVLKIPTEVKGFYTLDMTNRFSINRNFHAFLIITNVFNAHYGGIDAYGGLYDLRYNPQYGRNFQLGFSFTME